MNTTRKLLVLASMTSLVTGCTSLPPDAGFDEVSVNVEQRIANKVHWYTGGEEDAQVRQSIHDRLAQPLTADSAVQIALLNNYNLQAAYADLGISQADLVQAGLLKNPVLEMTRLKPRNGEDASLDIELRFEFLDILLIPLRKKVATQQFAAAKQRVTATVLDHAALVRKAFYEAQTSQHMEDMFREVTSSTEAALEAARRLRKIGNITAGTFDRFQLSHDETRLSLAQSEMSNRASREKLNQLMGLWGEQTQWLIEGGLKPIPFKPIDVNDIEKRAIANSLDLAILKHDIEALAERSGIENVKSIIDDLEAGYAWDRESSGEWSDGPTIELRIPIFDFGHARRARVAAELKQLQDSYYARAIEIRSSARALSDRLQSSRAMVEHYIDNILPLNRRIKDNELLNYNAMQIDVFKLLRAHEKQVASRQLFVQALRDYWLARADLETLLSGRANTVSDMRGPAISMGGGNEGGH
ncbi:MAG: TolC family protein [Gammaproteobacteria bacterium]|nr:MAG: TolC family protein [Gammaproteobacteria bacterium]